MWHYDVEYWLTLLTIGTILSGWFNYVVIKPLKETIKELRGAIAQIAYNTETTKADIHAVRERVARLEISVKDIREDIKRLEMSDRNV